MTPFRFAPIAILCLATASTSMIQGCGKRAAPATDMTSNPDKNDGRIDTAIARSGSAVRYAPGEARKTLWSIKWGTAQISYDGEGNVGGEMKGVDGRLYQKGEEASKFIAGTAKTEFGSRNLSLSGGVRVHIQDPPAEINAESVVWNPDLERIEAHGKVILVADELRFGPFEMLYATPDLKEISTPDLFRKTK